jgi:hypothetical protein
MLIEVMVLTPVVKENRIWSAVLPARSFAPLIVMVYVVPSLKSEEGVNIKVLPPDSTFVPALAGDIERAPVVAASCIASENTTRISAPVETPVVALAGVRDVAVGFTVSMVMDLAEESTLFSPQSSSEYALTR